MDGIDLACPLWQIEQHDLGRLRGPNQECGLLADGGSIARSKVQAIKLQRTPQDLEPGVTPRLKIVAHRFAGAQRRQIEPGVLMDRQRAIGARRVAWRTLDSKPRRSPIC